MRYKAFAIAAIVLSLPLLGEAQTKPKVGRAKAEQAALASVKGGKILSGEYEMEGGKHIWSFDVRTSGVIKEVWVDPVSGMVIKVENEPAGKEKNERSKETKMMPRSHMMSKPHMMSGSSKMAEHNSMIHHGISKIAAEKLAVKAVHGGKVLMTRKVRREKIVVWSVYVKTLKGVKDIWISPENGKVLKVAAANAKVGKQEKKPGKGANMSNK